MKAVLISGFALAMLTAMPSAQAAAPDAPPMPPPGMMKMPPPMEMMSLPGANKAAHIRIEDGDAAIDVKCADDDTTKACAEVTLQILDKVISLPKPQ